MAEFRIDRLRFNWKGAWATAVAYRKDDVVQYGGRVYVALANHTAASSFYTDLDNLVAGESTPRWELMNDGSEWKGDWIPSNFYKENDIVKYRGIIYRCIIAHTSASNITLGLESNSANWSVWAKGPNYLENWTAITNYKENDVVKYGGTVYICLTAHTSDTVTNGLEQDQAKWAVYNRSDFWKGVWQVNTRYVKDDVVRFGGNVYRCVIGHTSNDGVREGIGSDLGDDSTVAKWELIVEGIEFVGDWSGSQWYKTNDIVRYGPNLYRARIGMSGSDTFDDQIGWEIWVPGLGFEGLWNENELYQPGDIVTYGGYSYVALTINQGANPSAFGFEQDGDGANWEILTDGYKFKGEWDITLTYPPGSVVRKGGYLYESLDNILPVETIEPGDPDTDTSDKWRLIYTGVNWKAEWRESTQTDSSIITYYQGDVVMDESTTYICKKQHNSDIFEARPKLDTFPLTGGNLYWTVYGGRNESSAQNNVMRYKGDIRTYGYAGDDGSTVGVSRLAIGEKGSLLKVTEDNKLFYETLDEITKVYYVSTDGVDLPENGRNKATPWKTIKYALQYLQGNLNERVPATVFVGTGVFKEQLPMVIPRDTAVVGDELRSTVVMPADGDELKDMFRMHNGSGLRNMTLQGLTGTLGDLNANLTRRPTAGAYCSLDPGTGPDADYTWISTKSPYVQNVTTFGTACIGMKVDGDLHNGGNKSIVANDFTQILSDGIGYWANGEGKSELVSVFTYYCHIGYLATEGGKVRALNGNNSYGDYGCVAEGYDEEEIAITGTVNNQSQEAVIEQTYTNQDKIYGVAYVNAGQNYTDATLQITGNGQNFASTYNEFRDGAVSELFVTEEDSNFIGGSNYKFLANKAQIGTNTQITLSGADDEDDPDNYIGMRIFLYSGRGTGQYAKIGGFSPITKIATVIKESNGEPGWEHVTGYPIEAVLNDTTRYYIEPRVDIQKPNYTVANTNLGSSAPWTDMAKGSYQGNELIVITASNGQYSYSTDGNSFTAADLSGVGGLIATSYSGAGDHKVCIVDPTSGAVKVSDADLATFNDATLPALGGVSDATVSSIAGGDGNVIIGTVTSATSTVTEAIVSTDNGNSFATVTVPTADKWSSVAYGKDINTWVMLAGTADATSNNALWSTDNGTTWNAVTLPASSAWGKVEWGKDRFVATTNKTDSSSAETAVSFDGKTWYEGTMPEPGEWNGLGYNKGMWCAVKSDTGSTSDVVAFSRDGFHWDGKILTTANELRAGVVGYAHGNWVVATANETDALRIEYGCPALARAVVGSGRIGKFLIHEVGSNYTTNPTVSVFDTGNTLDVTVDARINNGVLPQPTVTNFGTGYFRSSAEISAGDGFAEIAQIADTLILEGISKLPGPGDNVSINGIDDVTYFVVKILEQTGVSGAYNLKLQISPNLGRKESPQHGEQVTIRQKYSQIRLTGHDFLDIGTGDFSDTNYPGLYVFGYNPDEDQEPKQFNEVSQYDGGRVFYTSTDQDGNFRVGELFEVEQATGTISINASFFELDGLEELRLGGVVLGGTGAVIREFSTDPTFAANSNNIVPTQKAIGAYVQSRVSSGGSDVAVNRLNAGNISFEGQKIFKVLGGEIKITTVANIKGQPMGDMAAQSYFQSGGAFAPGGQPGEFE
tara:strand:+ start:7531 stop:12444 length:4914 start_codon:yes stop_codon:yes gene_type:complete